MRTIDVCGEGELPPGEVAVVEDDFVGRIAVFNVSGELHAIEDRCSHQRAWLSEGYLEEEDCAVECPLHASSFDLRTGRPSTPPAIAPVRVFRAAVHDGVVRVELDEATG
ncbi:bifunctional 3-phenylpropionate/cinnamic acid dioxygenase ferredoxin subunit [Kineococcus glutinatus]|uniref:Bifunctional 3-phenylpropionate/cinnamic acid dioxygenase ferredoxin subunit n=1 Tax=Kineococcus glutinatus TaxID=1070872 RepID=A0ABP9H789_9ACTN